MVRVIAAAALGSIAVLMAILQVAAVLAASRRKRGYSLVPFLGGLLWIAACLVAPWRESWYALPFFVIVDPTPAFFAVAALEGKSPKGPM